MFRHSARNLGFICLFMLLSPFIATRQESHAPDSERPDATEIMRRSLSHWRRNMEAARNYTYEKRELTQELEKDGDTKKAEIKTYDVQIIYGEVYEKLIAKNDKPLSEKDQDKEEEKLNKFFQKQKDKSDAEREKENNKKRDEFKREIADELPKMYNWQIAGEDALDGVPVWILQADPKSEYHPNSTAGKLLSKMRGKVWITKNDYQWVKAESDLADDFSIGWFLFKLHKGTHLEFEQTRVNDEVWLPKSVYLKGSGRLAVKNARFEQTTTYSKYQKFKTDTKITGVVEEGPAKKE